ncbi:hypothetical protein COC43_23115 [Bacillus thuringiensis]|uniref:NAD(P)/FAD-dependent oxidoreductase n=1 Tax=Bacillus thuringiensis TaxID=1428 RepID=UPI000BFBCEE0|nr:NAD(P)/FAD-dependent oxidoreductase [Bacillus thuringiensis]PGR73101.1 hypothetical protein COC43_23115 [Bacillus thuringiensis]
MKEFYDVVILGGGPAGAVTASFLAKEGHKVILLESMKFPRQHIGESLLAVSMPYLYELGLKDILKENYIKKLGTYFCWGKEMFLGMPEPGYAYQVRRATFDSMLLKHCCDLGVKVVEEAKLTDTFFEDGKILGVQYKNKNNFYEVRCNHFVDASGQSKFLTRKLSLNITHNGPKRSALSAYFINVKKEPDPHAGDTITEATLDGWMWYIPLDNDETSIGFVGDEIDTKKLNTNEFFMKQLNGTEKIKKLVEGATMSTSPNVINYFNYIVEDKLWNKNYTIVGDAGFFVDPLFSTGVHGAVYSGYLAAKGISAVLKEEYKNEEVSLWYDKEIRQHYNRIQQTVNLLYGIGPGNTPFWKTRSVKDIALDNAQELVRGLGIQGANLFKDGMQDDSFNLPINIKCHLDEVFNPSKSKEIKLDSKSRLMLADNIKTEIGLAIHKGRLDKCLNISHVNNYTYKFSFPVKSFLAKTMLKIDGSNTVQELIEQLNDKNKSKQLFNFIQFIAKYGVLQKQ